MSDWQTRARCRTEGHPDMWHPEKRGNSIDSRRAKAICRQCDVQVDCLIGALRRGEREGIYAGRNMASLERRERQALIQKLITVPYCTACGRPHHAGECQRV